jgi:hypothetical protein
MTGIVCSTESFMGQHDIILKAPRRVAQVDNFLDQVIKCVISKIPVVGLTILLNKEIDGIAKTIPRGQGIRGAFDS